MPEVSYEFVGGGSAIAGFEEADRCAAGDNLKLVLFAHRIHFSLFIGLFVDVLGVSIRVCWTCSTCALVLMDRYCYRTDLSLDILLCNHTEIPHAFLTTLKSHQ